MENQEWHGGKSGMRIFDLKESGNWQEIAERAEVTECEKGLKVKLEEGKAVIACSRKAEYCRAIGWVRQWILEGKTSGYREETPDFAHLTYMADCSRNAVCSVAYLKKLLSWMALMGYDRLMLYTEDTYEIGGRPQFGWMRGRFSKEEIRELDACAAEYGIELVPCIQTLAHLNAIFRWQPFRPLHDTADILNTGAEETYALIEDMIRTWSENVRSRVINIGMDEAEMVGRGNFLNQFGYQERFDIMKKHLDRVLKICEKYGFTCMMWSDMFFKLISRGGYYSGSVQVTDEIRAKIPQNVELIYWDYYSRDAAVYDRMLDNHRKLAKDVGFAGGAWKWNGFAPLLHHSMQISGMALDACKKFGVQNVIVTGWGDDGGEAAQSCVLPVLSLYAESCYAGQRSEEWISERLAACTDACLEDFRKLDLPNLTPDNPAPGRVSVGPAKYLLYQDVLLGIYDRHVDAQSYPVHYGKTAQTLRAAAQKGGPFEYLFDTLAALCDALEYKCDLGIRIRQAYLNDDRVYLKELTDRTLETAEKVEIFRRKFKTQWFLENRPFGWEVQDIRLGGLQIRLISAAERIMDYLQGKTDKIEELEEQRLLLDERENPGFETLPLSDNNWKEIVTAAVM